MQGGTKLAYIHVAHFGIGMPEFCFGQSFLETKVIAGCLVLVRE